MHACQYVVTNREKKPTTQDTEDRDDCLGANHASTISGTHRVPLHAVAGAKAGADEILRHLWITAIQGSRVAKRQEGEYRFILGQRSTAQKLTVNSAIANKYGHKGSAAAAAAAAMERAHSGAP